jgi:hypothetical protein
LPLTTKALFLGLLFKIRAWYYLTFNFLGMNRSVLVLVVFFMVPLLLSGQSKSNKVPRPDLPGSFLVEFGFNQGLNTPDHFGLKFIGSHAFNLYYQYPMRFGKSKFSFIPGAGFSFERFKLKTAYTLKEDASNSGEFDLVSISTTYPSIKKTMLINNYIEMPIEFRFDTKPEDISRSLSIAIGGRVGYLMDAMTKIKYKEDGEVRKLKDKQNHGMNPIRYGVYTRLGVGSFSLFGYYNLSPLFEKDKGPDKTTMNTFTAGISINGL